jgi:predicted nicotinamide N-methyase
MPQSTVKDPFTIMNPSAIVTSGTTLAPVPLVPRIRLYQAAEPIGVWEHTELALGQTGLPPPFWAFAWPGGQALARYLLDHPGAVSGRRVLDMAAGSGLAAIAAALAGAAEVTACDVDPLAVAAIALNAAANGVTVTGRGDDLLAAGSRGWPVAQGVPGGPGVGDPGRPGAGDPGWPGEEGDLERPRGVGDPGRPGAGDPGWPGAVVVLIADAFYARDLAAMIMGFVEHVRAHGADVLIADPGRAYLPRTRLVPLASYDVPGVGALEDADCKPAMIWKPAW